MIAPTGSRIRKPIEQRRAWFRSCASIGERGSEVSDITDEMGEPVEVRFIRIYINIVTSFGSRW
jgi:hypothetical protein